jgi:hypothetical protein
MVGSYKKSKDNLLFYLFFWYFLSREVLNSCLRRGAESKTRNNAHKGLDYDCLFL